MKRALCHPDRRVVAFGLCSKCYQRKRFGRDPEKVEQRMRGNQDLRTWIERWRSEPTERGCREWLRKRNQRGYGIYRVDGKAQRVTRLYWALVNGAIPPGLFVCHHCDNPSCVELSHLFLGTHLDNMRDCERKGRFVPNLNVRGDNHPQAKLTSRDVERIRALGGSKTQAAIARDFGVTPSLVSMILNDKIWVASHA